MAANDFKTIARMVEHWRSSGVKLRPPATEAGIVAFEQRFGVRLPLDMRHYFLLTDGMDYGAWDNNNFSFWELERLRPLAEQLPEPIHASYRNFPDAKCFFCFADWLIDCTVFRVYFSRPVARQVISSCFPQYSAQVFPMKT